MKPKLRFQGFHDDWEEKKLGDVSEIIMGQSPNSDSYNDIKNGIPLIQGNADIIKGKTIQRIYTTKPTKICDKNSLLMTVRAPVGEVGISTEEICIGRGICCIDYKNINYIKQYLNANIGKWKILSQGSTFESVNSKDIKSFKIFLPSLSEQEKIGAFLSQIDDRIEKQEQKIALLKERKKGWMQQLFSQTIRFKDENGQDYPAWEEKKLGEVLEEQYKGKKSKESENGNLLLTTDYLDNREYSYVDELNNVNSKDILILWDGSQAGKVYTGYEGVLGSTFMKVSTYDYIASNYIYHFLNYNKKLIQEKWRTGSGIPHVSKDFISSFLISLPSLPEQEKIAEFLSKQDELIEKEEEKLSLLKEQKKGLLQQMFV